jgi:hypothetical protein
MTELRGHLESSGKKQTAHGDAFHLVLSTMMISMIPQPATRDIRRRETDMYKFLHLY